jgi:hypothetical protein
MAYSREIREKLRRSYVFDKLALEKAAELHDVPFITARRWKSEAKKAGDDWDKQRDAHMMAGGSIEDTARGILSNLIIQFTATSEALNDIDINALEPKERIAFIAKRVDMLASLADAYNKGISASKKILPETSELATAMQVITMFSEFIASKYPQHLSAFAEVLEPFGEEIEKKYG